MDNTPYDDVFRTLLTDCTELIIPVVNFSYEIYRKRKNLSASKRTFYQTAGRQFDYPNV